MFLTCPEGLDKEINIWHEVLKNPSSVSCVYHMFCSQFLPLQGEMHG